MTQFTDSEEQMVIPDEDEEELEGQPLPEKATIEVNGEDLSDLIAPPKMSDPDMYTDDLVTLNVKDDIMDGDLSDLVEVSEEDIMGEDILGVEEDMAVGAPPASQPAEPVKRYRIAPRGRQVIKRVTPPSSMGGIGY